MENITVGRKKRINKKESWEKVNGNKRNSKKLNILLAIICILLIGVLGSIFMMSRESEKAEHTVWKSLPEVSRRVLKIMRL